MRALRSRQANLEELEERWQRAILHNLNNLSIPSRMLVLEDAFRVLREDMAQWEQAVRQQSRLFLEAMLTRLEHTDPNLFQQIADVTEQLLAEQGEVFRQAVAGGRIKVGDDDPYGILAAISDSLQAGMNPELALDVQNYLTSDDIFETPEDVAAKIAEYERQFGIDSEEFLQRWRAGAIEDTFETMDWMMLLRQRNALQNAELP